MVGITILEFKILLLMKLKKTLKIQFAIPVLTMIPKLVRKQIIFLNQIKKAEGKQFAAHCNSRGEAFRYPKLVTD